MNDHPQFVTRKTGVEAANAEGIPLTKSRVDKECSNGTGPEPVARFGRIELYGRAPFLVWARSLITPPTTEIKPRLYLGPRLPRRSSKSSVST
jgi:hypothetical protein